MRYRATRKREVYMQYVGYKHYPRHIADFVAKRGSHSPRCMAQCRSVPSHATSVSLLPTSAVQRHTLHRCNRPRYEIKNKKKKERERDVCRSFDGIYRCVHECVRRLLMYRKKRSTKGDKRERLLKTKSASSCSHYIAVYVASPNKKYSECTRVPNVISS